MTTEYFSYSFNKLKQLSLLQEVKTDSETDKKNYLGQTTVKLTIDEDLTLKTFNEQFLTNQNDHDRIELLIKYFNTKNDYDLPLIFNSIESADVENRTQFIINCEQTKLLLESMQITKYYWYIFKDEDFHQKLREAIEQIKVAAEIFNKIDACKNDKKQFEQVFNELYNNTAILKRIRAEYHPFSFGQNAMSELLVSAPINLTYIPSNWHSPLNVDGYNVGVDATAALFWAASASNLVNQPKFWGLKLLVQKKLILYLVEKRNRYEFTEMQIKFIEGIVKHKRGGLLKRSFTKMFLLDTASYVQLKKNLLKKESVKNLPEEENVSAQKLYTEVDYICDIKQDLAKGAYDQINEMIVGRVLGDNIELAMSTSFKLNGIYGTLYTHLLVLLSKANKLNNTKNITQLEKLVNNIENKVSDSLNSSNHTNIRFPIINLLKKDYNSYDEFYLYLKQYRPLKHEAIDSISQIIFAIKTSDFTPKEKESLIQALRSELNFASDGNFRDLRHKRLLFHSNLFFGITAFNGYSLYRYLQPIDNNIFVGGITGSIMVRATESSLGWMLTALLPGVSEWWSMGDTTTWLSLREILDSVNFDHKYKTQLGEYEEKIINAKKTATKLEEQKDNHPINSDFVNKTQLGEYEEKIIDAKKTATKLEEQKDNHPINSVQEYILTLREYILNDQDNNILIVLQNISQNKTLLYCVLSGKTGGGYLIDMLLKKFQSADDTKFGQIWKLWCDAQPKTPKNDDGDIEQMRAFKIYLATFNFIDAHDALLGFYSVMAYIGNTTNPNRKIKKLNYFAEVIMRAANDPTSKWAMLRKTSRNRELIYSTIIRVIGVVIYASINTIVYSGIITGVTAPIVLLLSGAIRGLFSGLANLYTYSDTIEYKTSTQLLFPKDVAKQNTLINLLSSNSKDIDMILKKFKQNGYRSCTDKITLVNENYCLTTKGVLIINSTTLNSTKLDEYFTANGITNSIIEDSTTNSIIDDSQFINKLNAIQSKDEILTTVDQVILELSREAVDKYAATEIIYRLIRIIYLSTINEIIKLELLIGLSSLLMRRELDIFQHISTERSSLNLGSDIFSGIIASSANAASLYVSNIIMAALNTIIDITAFSAAMGTADMCTNSIHKDNTKSYQQCLKFIKICMMDIILKNKLNDETEQNETIQLVGLAKLVLGTHSARYSSHNPFNTNSLAQFDAILEEIKKSRQNKFHS